MMKTITVLIAVLTLSSSADASNHCTPPRQPPGTGNSLMTWHIPKNCPLTPEQRAAKARCQAMPARDRPRSCWGYGLQRRLVSI
jgi:hypothetical protein